SRYPTTPGFVVRARSLGGVHGRAVGSVWRVHQPQVPAFDFEGDSWAPGFRRGRPSPVESLVDAAIREHALHVTPRFAIADALDELVVLQIRIAVRPLVDRGFPGVVRGQAARQIAAVPAE